MKKRNLPKRLWRNFFVSGIISVVEFVIGQIVGDYILHFLEGYNISLAKLFNWISKHTPITSGILFLAVLTVLFVIDIFKDHQKQKKDESEKEKSLSGVASNSFGQSGGTNLTVGKVEKIEITNNPPSNQAAEANSASQQEEPINISIEPPLFPMDGPNVIRFTLINRGKKKLVNCHAKADVIGVYPNQAGGFTLSLHPSNYMYPNNVLWKTKSIDGNVNLMPGDPAYLDVIELGQSHFRFLFDGVASLSNGTLEPSNISGVDPTWLSHKYHVLTLKLFGEDVYQNPFEINKEFALTFLVGNGPNLSFDRNGKPTLDNTKPNTTSIIIIRDIKSHENIKLYFGLPPGTIIA